MAQDPDLIKYTGKVIIGAEYALRHNLRDVDNRVILSYRSIRFMVSQYLPVGLQFLANLIPASLRIPQAIIDITNSKFT